MADTSALEGPALDWRSLDIDAAISVGEALLHARQG